MSSNQQGSIWRKWDLHIHTQASDGISSNEEIIEHAKANHISVLGITDHHTAKNIDNLKKLGKENGITIIPGIEFCTELGKHSVHLIALFPDVYNATPMNSKNIYDLILSPLNLSEATIQEKGREGNSKASSDEAFKAGIFKTQVEFSKAADLIHKYGGLVIPHNGTKSNGMDQEISHEGKPGTDIYNSLGPLKDELCKSGSIDAFDIPLKNYHNQRDFYWKQLNIPSIVSSDAHSAAKIGTLFSWIKADASFEGLKQALFEPKRIWVGENPPSSPIHHIKTLTTNFPENTYFKNSSNASREVFCFSGNQQISFSPEFTCIIGGRGTGKSTLLSFLGKFLGKASDSILESITYPSEKRFSDLVNILGMGDFLEADYISQSQVADFANNPETLTNAIYQRIAKLFPFENILNTEKEIETIGEQIQHEIEQTKILASIEYNLRKNQIIKQSKQNLVNSLTSKEYQDFTTAFKRATEEYSLFIRSKQTFLKICDSIGDIVSFPEISKMTNTEYDLISKSILEQLKKISYSFDRNKLDEKEANLLRQKKDAEANLTRYLTDRNITQESVNDIVKAQMQLKEVEEQIIELTEQKNNIKQQNFLTLKESFEKANSSYNDYLNEILSEIETKLDIKNPNVKKISISLEKNNSKLEASFWQEFRKEFESKFKVIAEQLGNPLFAYKENYIKSLFENIDLAALCTLSQQECTEKLSLSDNETNLTKRILFRLLNNPYRLLVFKLLILKHFFNLPINKKFNILYDGRTLEKTSFGQRCTATIITLLSLGNTPIIIDEPEAHLDSLLIADYLVQLIKERKFERQIIFATHNPNFVVNGDADLIIFLYIDENSKTQIKYLTIEDLENRDKILTLEGGKEAFKKRENKYHMVF